MRSDSSTPEQAAAAFYLVVFDKGQGPQFSDGVMTQAKANETVDMLKSCGVAANVIRMDATAHSLDNCRVTARSETKRDAKDSPQDPHI